MTEESQSPEKALKLLEALKKLPDPRDNRGKRHDQVFVLYGCVLAIMTGLSTGFKTELLEVQAMNNDSTILESVSSCKPDNYQKLQVAA